ncbi:MAG: PhzF family phenazine biosynthesis protein [Minwuia sp.]|nr:PhzF family phenazine biosynthesis protein [Minwuia sp.]
MTRTKRLWQVDAFTADRYRGNPCAVFFDGGDLGTDEMQRIAQEMNLSETVFLCPPTVEGADYRARIFTPRNELPFAGHPTISAAFCVLNSMRDAGFGPLPTVLHQECLAGIVPVAISQGAGGETYTMTQVAPAFRTLDVSRSDVASMLGCDVDELVGPGLDAATTGIWWMFARCTSPEVVARLEPDMTAISVLSMETGITGLGAWSVGGTLPGVDVKLRCFAPAEGVPEDPVTGSANGCLASLIARDRVLGDAPVSFLAEQGVEMGRAGLISASVPAVGAGPNIGGQVVRVMVGDLTI